MGIKFDMKIAVVGNGAGKTTLPGRGSRLLRVRGPANVPARSSPVRSTRISFVNQFTKEQLASDAIRGGLERHFGVKLAFQNCHRVAAFRPAAVGGDRYRAFVSPRGQLLNQSPELRNC